nr:MAG TPA: hypothetical protein [Caudoviricetes sp.]
MGYLIILLFGCMWWCIKLFFSVCAWFTWNLVIRPVLWVITLPFKLLI